MKKILILALASMAALAPLAQRTTRTTRTNLRKAADVSAPATQPVPDTVVAPADHTVDVNGYDKPLRSRRETFFVTNNDTRAVQALAFTIEYLDESGRQLHSASHHVEVDIPAAETRQVSVRSWDTQQSFYYRRSTAPARVEQATPYDVKIAVDTIFFAR